MGETQAPGFEGVLLSRVASGDQEAFADLFRRYERPLYAYFFRLVQDRAAAEELVCDTMMAVWRGASTFRGAASVSTWVFGIAHNLGAGVLRRRRPVVSLDEIDPLPAGGGPEAAAERADVAARVRRAVATLSPEHREVIELTFDQGFSYPEIARILRVPVNTVKTRMFYARQRLKVALERVGITDAD